MLFNDLSAKSSLYLLLPKINVTTISFSKKKMLLLLLINKTVKYGTFTRRTPIREEESFFFSFSLILKLIIFIKEYFKIYNMTFTFFNSSNF